MMHFQPQLLSQHRREVLKENMKISPNWANSIHWWRASDMMEIFRTVTKWTCRWDCFLNCIYYFFLNLIIFFKWSLQWLTILSFKIHIMWKSFLKFQPKFNSVFPNDKQRAQSVSSHSQCFLMLACLKHLYHSAVSWANRCDRRTHDTDVTLVLGLFLGLCCKHI